MHFWFYGWRHVCTQWAACRGAGVTGTAVAASGMSWTTARWLAKLLCEECRLVYDTSTHTTVSRPLIRDYPDRPVPVETHPLTPDHRTSFINFLRLLRSIASSLFSLRAWQSSLTTSLQVLFGLPLGLGPATSFSPTCISSPSHYLLFYTSTRNVFPVRTGTLGDNGMDVKLVTLTLN